MSIRRWGIKIKMNTYQFVRYYQQLSSSILKPDNKERNNCL